ncbi:thioredoxin-like associated protein 1, putative [Hepatocystis sp. ex Piliocolobus tephrosceles]|nr:thioredoxin-like associated protein 1, putative [Hepatocystis sp. ex Piliocolobus tephrosceles]
MFGKKIHDTPNMIMTPEVYEREDKKIKHGKKLVIENCGKYMNKDKNAGVVCNRISELNMNSRKNISFVKTDSSQMKDVLNHAEHTEIENIPSKRPLVSYSKYDDQQKYFETKIIPNEEGKMSIYVKRKNGSATVNINIDEYDLEKTYHTWKRILGKTCPHIKSNLEFDRFLTVNEDAKRSDKIPVIINRGIPIANPDGPFEKERLDQPEQARDHLDRTLTPLNDNKPKICLKLNNDKYKQSNVFPNYYQQPNNNNTTTVFDDNNKYNNNEEIISKNKKSARTVNYTWMNSNRIKNILTHNYDDEIEQKYKYGHNNIIKKNVNSQVNNNNQQVDRNVYIQPVITGKVGELNPVEQVPTEINYNTYNDLYREQTYPNNTNFLQNNKYNSESYKNNEQYKNVDYLKPQQNCIYPCSNNANGNVSGNASGNASGSSSSSNVEKNNYEQQNGSYTQHQHTNDTHHQTCDKIMSQYGYNHEHTH